MIKYLAGTTILALGLVACQPAPPPPPPPMIPPPPVAGPGPNYYPAPAPTMMPQPPRSYPRYPKAHYAKKKCPVGMHWKPATHVVARPGGGKTIPGHCQ